MTRPIVAVADHAFAPFDVERALLEEAGAEIRLGEALDEEAVIALAVDADAILCDAAPITRRVLGALPRLRVVAEYGIGYDNIDAAAATELGVWVANVPGFCTEEVADHTLALALSLLRRVASLDRVLRAGGWGATAAGPIRRIRGQTLGVLGFGRIGQLVATKARAVGLNVIAHSPHITAERAGAVGAQAATLDELLARSDVLCLNAPANAETRGIIDAAALGRMKSGAYLVNCGRGALVDEVALADALTSGHLAGAALDVFATEPLDGASPLRRLDNVILTPHAAFYSEESLSDLQTLATRNVLAVLRGGAPDTPVNPEVAPRARSR